MLAISIFIFLLTVLLIVYFYKRNLYNSIRNGDVGPILYLAKPTLGFKNHLYSFRYKYSNGSWHAYVEKMPSSALFSDYSYKNPYIFFVQPIQSFDEIKRRSFSWADKMQATLSQNERG